MSEPDDKSGEPQSPADRTLLGVAPPRLDSVDLAPRNPVFVRAGDSVADVELAPPRVALPSRPPRSEIPPAFASNAGAVNGESATQRALRTARKYPVLWMVAAPALVSLCVVGLAVATAPTPVPKPAATIAATVAPATMTPTAAVASASLPSIAELSAKPPGSLSPSELVRLSDAKLEERRKDAQALHAKLVQNPALLADKATQVEVLQAAREPLTASPVLGALAEIGSPTATDLLYEVWTGTPARSDATELARALLYNAMVRAKASPALAVALDLRGAESCEGFKSAMPGALKSGDKRSLHLLGKLVNRRGCGPKKADDCYACLREDKDELVATINAVKSRRAPVYPTP
jgi:hypothetical protein